MKKIITTKSIFIILVMGLFSTRAYSQTAYITNIGDSTVWVINVATNTVIDTITVGGGPCNVSVSPDGTKVYVANSYNNTVSVINTATHSVSATITVGTTPYGIFVSPDGSKVFVANSGDNTITIINTLTNTVSATISAGSNSRSLCVDPNGTKLYLSNAYSNTVSVINIITNTVIATIPVGTTPWGITVSPDGTKVYVANDGTNTVSVINTVTNTILATITVGINPYCISINPDGSKAYVTNSIDSTVSVINTATNSVLATIRVGFIPYGISVSPDGSKVYVVNDGSTSVSVINPANNNVTTTIAVGNSPIGFGNFISIYPFVNCDAHYTTSYDSTLNNFTLVVDSAASAVATGYHWDFGDGTTSTLATPSHTYSMDTIYYVCMKIYVASGDSCEYCHYIGKDYLGNIYRTAGFTLNVNNNSTVNVPSILKNEKGISIFPNPFISKTTIAFNEEQRNTTIKVMNILGEVVYQSKIQNQISVSMDMNDVAKGIYFMRIEDENKNVVNRKIVVE